MGIRFIVTSQGWKWLFMAPLGCALGLSFRRQTSIFTGVVGHFGLLELLLVFGVVVLVLKPSRKTTIVWAGVLIAIVAMRLTGH